MLKAARCVLPENMVTQQRRLNSVSQQSLPVKVVPAVAIRRRQVLLSSLVVILVLLGKHPINEATTTMVTVCLARQASFQALLAQHNVNHATPRRHQKLAPPFASNVMPVSSCRHHRLPPPPPPPLLLPPPLPPLPPLPLS